MTFRDSSKLSKIFHEFSYFFSAFSIFRCFFMIPRYKYWNHRKIIASSMWNGNSILDTALPSLSFFLREAIASSTLKITKNRVPIPRRRGRTWTARSTRWARSRRGARRRSRRAWRASRTWRLPGGAPRTMRAAFQGFLTSVIVFKGVLSSNYFRWFFANARIRIDCVPLEYYFSEILNARNTRKMTKNRCMPRDKKRIKNR